jgi:glyceraldehyde 3-phosphate dehydrogenase
VPTPNVSVIDFKFVPKRLTTKDEINSAVRRAVDQQLRGVLGYTEAPECLQCTTRTLACLPSTRPR